MFNNNPKQIKCLILITNYSYFKQQTVLPIIAQIVAPLSEVVTFLLSYWRHLLLSYVRDETLFQTTWPLLLKLLNKSKKF